LQGIGAKDGRQREGGKAETGNSKLETGGVGIKGQRARDNEKWRVSNANLAMKGQEKC
jgi:hypothetical protein